MPENSFVPVVLMLVSAFSHALFNALTKRAEDKLVFRALFLGFSGLLFLPLTFFVPLPTPEAWTHLGISVFIHGIYFYTTIAAFNRGDMGLVYPIMRGLAIVIAAMIAFAFLGEAMSLTSAAALCVAASVLVLFAWPEKGGAINWKAILLAVASAMMIASYSVNDAAGTRDAETALSYIVWFFVAVSIPISASALFYARNRLRTSVPRELKVALPTSFIGITSFATALYAFNIAPVADMIALRETSVVFGALLATFMLKEQFGLKRIILAAILAICLIVMQVQ